MWFSSPYHRTARPAPDAVPEHRKVVTSALSISMCEIDRADTLPEMPLGSAAPIAPYRRPFYRSSPQLPDARPLHPPHRTCGGTALQQPRAAIVA